MKSVDTNVVVRLIAKDDPLQTSLAEAAFTQPVFVGTGVLMETEWVLRSRYRWDRERVCDALEELISLECVSVDNLHVVLWAVERHRAGADLADMLHIAASGGADAFLTFERNLDALAGPNTPVAVERLQ